jgi:outer membrane protein
MTPFLRSILSVAALGLALRVLPAEAQGETRIGYVNLQRAILEVDEGKKAKSALKATFDEKQKRLSAKEAELAKAKDVLDKETDPNNPETRKKIVEFQGKLGELRETFMKEQQDLQKQEQAQLGQITAKMRKVIDKLGKARGYTLILEVQDSRLLFAKPHLDLTNEVIREYNDTKF